MNKAKTHTSNSLKPLLLLAGVLGVLFSGYGQGGFSRIYQEGIIGHDIIFDGTDIITATDFQTDSGDIGIRFLRTDTTGQIIDQDSIKTPSINTFTGYHGSLKKRDSTYVLTGSNRGQDTYGFLLEVDRNFDTVAFTSFQYQGEQTFPRSCVLTADGGTFVTGENFVFYPSDSLYRREVLAAKFDAQANLEWIKSFAAPQVAGQVNMQYGYNVITSNNSYVITGPRFRDFTSDSGDSFILNLDSNGNEIWMKIIGSSSITEVGQALVLTTDSTFLFGTSWGVSNTMAFGQMRSINQIKYIHYNLDGTKLWEKDYGPKGVENSIQDILLTPDGDFLAIGSRFTDPDDHSTQSKYVYYSYSLMLNAQGDSIWYREYSIENHPNDYDILIGAQSLQQGGFVAAGRLYTSQSPITGQPASHLWIIKTDSLGCVVQGCQNISIAEEGSVSRISLYPNPTKGTFQMEGLQGLEAELKIYNSSGQEVLYQPAVHEKQSIQLHHQPAGLYLVQVLQKGKALYSTKLLVQP